MKILWVVKNFPPSMGGVQQYSFHYVQNMPSGSCVVLTRKQRDEKEANKFDKKLGLNQQKVYRISSLPENLGIFSILKHPLLFFSFCVILFKIIRKEQTTHILFGHPSFFYFFSLLPLKLILHQPFFISIFHGEDIPTIYLKSNGLFRWLINRLDACVCNSIFTYSRVQDFLGKRLAQFIAYPGVEEKFFQPMDRHYCKSQFGVNGKKVIYTVGRLDERKGHDLVIKAMPEIIKKVPDVIYLIGGKGPYLSKLQSLVEELNLQNYVRLCGFIADKDICAFHHCGDIFVMPNRILDDGDTEGFGIVFLEAAAAGNPVIGGRAGGAVDAVIDGQTGFLVDPYSEEEFIEKTLHLLTSPAEADKMGTNGRIRAYNSFRWPKLADSFIQQLAGIKK